MDNSINTSPDKKKIEDLINEQNLRIFDEEIWINKELWKIAEVTYSYDSETRINTTLFCKIGWLNIAIFKESNEEEKIKLINEARKNLEKILKEKKKQIQNALNEIELLEIFTNNSIEIDQKSIFINALIEKYKFLDYAQNWIDFELIKAWLKTKVNEKELKILENSQKEIDKELFWWDIKENPLETKISYEYIKKIYDERKDKLTSIEQKRFEEYLNKIKPYLPKWYKYTKKIIPKRINWNFLDIELPREDYMLSFNILVESLEKLEHIVETNSEAKSISDWPKWVQFPTWPKFDYMNILRFCKLGYHEIITHNISDYNSRQLLWNTRGANSTEKDEWVAMLMEQLFSYWNELYTKDSNWNLLIDINKIQINSYFTKTLMWELLTNDELIDFLELSEKIDPDVISPIERYYRLKRNNLNWVQHKDTTYTRWLFKAVEEINKYIISKWKKWIAPEDLFIWKISFEETNKLINIKKNKEKKWENIEILKPIFILDAVWFIVNEKINWEEWNLTWPKFFRYLKNKYPMFDFLKEQIREVSLKTKTNVYWIVNIILKNHWKNELEKMHAANILKDEILQNTLKIIQNQYEIKISNVKQKLHPSRRNAK